MEITSLTVDANVVNDKSLEVRKLIDEIKTDTLEKFKFEWVQPISLFPGKSGSLIADFRHYVQNRAIDKSAIFTNGKVDLRKLYALKKELVELHSGFYCAKISGTGRKYYIVKLSDIEALMSAEKSAKK